MKLVRGQALPDALSTAVLKFCEENFEYSGHLSVHGSITVIADETTTVGFFSKALPKHIGESRCEAPVIQDGVLQGNLSCSMVKHTTLLTEVKSEPQDVNSATSLPQECWNPPVGGGTSFGENVQSSIPAEARANRELWELQQGGATSTSHSSPVSSINNTSLTDRISTGNIREIPRVTHHVNKKQSLFNEHTTPVNYPLSAKVADRKHYQTSTGYKYLQRTLAKKYKRQVMHGGNANIGIKEYVGAAISQSPGVGMVPGLVEGEISHIVDTSNYSSPLSNPLSGESGSLAGRLAGNAISSTELDQQAPRTEHFHSSGAKPFVCVECGQGFSFQATLTQHMKCHRCYKFKCEQCGKSFSQKGTLNRHILVHTGIKPYSCSFCGKAFNNKSNLHRHAYTHQERKKNPDFISVIE